MATKIDPKEEFEIIQKKTVYFGVNFLRGIRTLAKESGLSDKEMLSWVLSQINYLLDEPDIKDITPPFGEASFEMDETKKQTIEKIKRFLFENEV